MSKAPLPLALAAMLCLSLPLAAQDATEADPEAAAAESGGAGVELKGGLRQDTSAPVEVESDQLTVDQDAGTAIFTGNVRVKQGEMRMTAAEATLEYTEDGNDVERVVMTGGVTMTNGKESAKGKDAVYTIATGEVVMTGDVLLTQGKSTINGTKLTVDLDTGLGRMEGRVQTVFVPGKKK